MPVELDDSSLSAVFSWLPGESLAACALVCRAWQAVAYGERLWEAQCRQLEPHPHLARDDLMPYFSGSRRKYYAWRWPLLRHPVHRIAVESSHLGSPLATYPAPTSMADSSSGPDGKPVQPPAAMCAVESEPGAWVQQATLSPVGGLLAFTEVVGDFGGGQHMTSRVVVADASSGRRVCSLALGEPFPPFYYMWCHCGTRLLFLSNWGGDVVALRAADLAPALLPPATFTPGAPPLPALQDVLLCCARPLFLAVSPTSTRLVWHGGQREMGLCDAATAVAEDGAEHDCFYVNPAPCGSQAPQWVLDDSGASMLLLPVMHEQPAEGEGGVLVAVRLSSLAAALEAEGSRLPPSLLLSLGHRIAPFSSSRDLFYAASPRGAAIVAWCDRGELWVSFRESGMVQRIYPPPLQAPARHDQQQQQEGGVGGAAERRKGGSVCAWHGGSVLAMQWSPSGRRLLLLVRRRGAGPIITLGKHPQFRWVVWDAPTPDPAVAATARQPGWLGTLTFCAPYNPAVEFLDRFLPFFDQYQHSLRLWDPDSRAVVFAARGQLAERGHLHESNVYIQPVPEPSLPDNRHSSAQDTLTEAGPSSAGGSSQGTVGLAEAPPAVWLAAGNMASWSWQ